MRQAGRYMAGLPRAPPAVFAARDLRRARAGRRGHAAAGRTPSTSTRRSSSRICCCPFTPMGLDFDFVKGEGPSIEQPGPPRVRRRSPAAVRAARGARARAGDDPAAAAGARREGAAHRLRRRAVHAWRPTRSKAAPRRSYATTKAFMYAQPEAWHRLCDRFATMMADYLRAQIEAGAQAVQVFDSWAGQLVARRLPRVRAAAHQDDLRRARRTPASRRCTSASAPARSCADMREAGGDVIGVDWRQPLDEAWAAIGHDRGIQGNLDPTLLLGPSDRMCARGRRRPAPRRRPRRATSSISATASCRRRPSSTSRHSRGTCTRIR